VVRAGPPRVVLWLLVPLLVATAAGIASQVSIERGFTLDGVLSAAEEMTLAATVRGRVEHLHVRPGTKVSKGEAITELLDLDVRAQLDRIEQGIKALDEREKRPAEVVAGVVPASLRLQINRAEEALDRTTSDLRARREAFNRREASIGELQKAQDGVREASARLVALRTEAEAYRQRKRYRNRGPSKALLAERDRLALRREQLARRLRVSVVSTSAGVLVSAAKSPVRIGDVVEGGQPLFRVVDTSRLKVELSVPPERLVAIQDVDRISVAPVGDPEKVVDLQPEEVAAVAGPDGNFPWVAAMENDGSLRPGQTVRARVAQPSISALGWLFGR